MITFWSTFHIQILWYSFNRDNGFLLTSSQSYSGKQENPSSSFSKHISSSLSVYLFLDSELSNWGWKYRSRELLKAIFLSPKIIRKPTGSAWSFLQPPIQVCRGAHISYFKINAMIRTYSHTVKCTVQISTHNTGQSFSQFG